MAAQIVGTFDNQISAGARQAAADLRGLERAATSTTSALGALSAAGGSAIPSGSGGRAGGAAPAGGGAPRPRTGGAAAPKASADELRVAREKEAAAKYVAGIREREFLAQQRRDEKLERDKARASSAAARKAAREQEANVKYVQGIKDRYMLSEQRRQEKEERDTARTAGAAARKSAREEEANRKHVAAIRDRYMLAEQKRQEKEEKAKAKKGTPGERLKAAGAAGGAAVADQALDKLKSAAGIVGLAYGAKELGQLALGYRGMERLAGITARAQFRFRQLFAGVQPKPLLDTIERVSFLFSKQTIAGRALSGIFERGFNGFFGAVKGAEPFLLDFVKGVILGALRLEQAWLKARIALFPLTSALGGFFNQVGVGSAIGQAAIGLIAVKLVAAAGAAVGLSAATLGTVAPFIALAAAAGLAYNAIKKTFDEQSEAVNRSINDESKRMNLIAQARQEQAKTGKISEPTRKALVEQEKRLSYIGTTEVKKAGVASQLLGTAESEDRAAMAQRMAILEDLEQTRRLLQASGQSAGAAMGAGVVAGMKGAEAAVTAGGAALGAAADKGVRSPAGMDARSPARKGIRSGRDMGEGVALGMEASEERVAKAAASSLAPDVPSAAKGRSGAMAGESIGGARVVHLHFPGYLGTPEDLLGVIRRAIADEFTLVLGAEGLDTQGAT